jgi:hypothetical protein
LVFYIEKLGRLPRVDWEDKMLRKGSVN